MITATWDWLWDKHDQAKDLLSFFVHPNASNMSKEKTDSPGDNGDGNKRSYKTPQLIGLFLGPISLRLCSSLNK